MVACFCRSFAAEPGATLLLKLTHHDGTQGLALILRLLWRLAPFACRVVLIHGFLDDEAYHEMVRVTSYVVNSAHGEGQCLPLMEFMSAGKPAIAPPHTGMADYVTADCAYLVDSSAGPRAYVGCFLAAGADPARYDAMSGAATASLQRHCSAEVVLGRLRGVLDQAVHATVDA